jgi:hypothetical protein
MDAETMTNEELDALAERIKRAWAAAPGSFGGPWRAVAREAVRWADERAALRAQAKAEPVAWLEKDTLLSLTPNEFRAHVKDYPDAAAEFFPVFTAPPPDHAEALAEVVSAHTADLRRSAEVLGENAPAFARVSEEINVAADELDAALTRYKGRTNG